MDYANLISNVGFPIAMCCYFMFRFEKVLANNTKATNELKIAIAKMNSKRG